MGAYQKEIELVKAKIIEQGVPVKYPKGLAILCVLNCAYEGGDAMAGLQLESAMKSDPELVEEFERCAGVKGKTTGRYCISNIRDEFAKRFQIFRALKAAGANMDLFWSVENVP